MSAFKTGLLSAILCCVATTGAAEEPAKPSPDQILSDVSDAYRGIETLKLEGTAETDIQALTGRIQQKIGFQILLEKPNRFLISWDQKEGITAQSGVAWSDGTQPYLYLSTMNAYSKMSSDEVAIGGATGVSGGVARTIPALFLKAFEGQSNVIDRLKNATLEGSESVGGEECYVISATSDIATKETLWVSKKTHLIRKHTRSLSPPDGSDRIPELTDKDAAETLSALGEEVTEASKQKMQERMEQVRKMFQRSKIAGSLSVTYDSVTQPELEASDFQFSPPEDAELKESLFGGFLGR